MRGLTITCVALLVCMVLGSYSTCKQYIQALTMSILHKDYAALPLPTIMYSGITTNNPGQMYECEHKTAASDPYHYLLISFKNATNNVQTFTGICVPSKCGKEEVEAALLPLQVKYDNIYDYPESTSTDGLVIASLVIVGLWVAVLVVWSIILSFREPVQNQFIKKDEEVRPLNESQEPVNALSERRPEVREDFRLFNFYEGYCRIFKRTNQKHMLGSFLFLATFSIIFSTQFSYRQTIAANEVKSLKWFDSLGGVLFCNVQIAFNVIMFVLGTKLAYALYKLSSFHEIGRYFFDQLLVKWAILVLTTMGAYVILSLVDQPLNQLWKNKYGADCPSVMYQMWFVFRTLVLDCKVCLQWFWVLEVDILLTILAAPLFIVYRTKRWLGYSLFGLTLLISWFFSFAVLQSQNIVFEPYKLFNMVNEFTVNYQTNALVRMSPYFIGVVVGLFINQRIEKNQKGQNDLAIIQSIKNNQNLQVLLHLVGVAVMIMTFLFIIPYLQVAQPGEKRTEAHAYLVFNPFGFLAGLILFLLPCWLEGQSKLTMWLGKVMKASMWNSLQKMALGFLVLGPVVIGFTTYSMQNSIYFDFETILVYFLGDSVIIYILTLLAISSIDSQLCSASKWMQAKLFGNQAKYSVIVIEE